MAQSNALLVIGLNWIGDAVMSLPVLHVLREHYPDSEIYVASRGWSADVYRMSPAVDHVVTVKKGQGFSTATEFFKSAWQLRKAEAENAVILPNSFYSALLAYFSRVSHRYGYYTEGRSFLLSSCVGKLQPEEVHTVLRYRKLLNDCLDISWPEGEEKFELDISEEERSAAMEKLQQRGLKPDRQTIGFSPGAAWGEAKAWPPEHFAAAADELLRKSENRCAVFFGSEKDHELNETITGSMKGPAVNAAGAFDSLMQLAAAIDSCHLMICNDSGPMHLAAALATPVVALFGPSDENRTGPWAPAERKRVLRAPGSQPWKRFRHDSTEPRTMDRIPVEAVITAAEELLDSEAYQ